jgi:hypothetical protein
LNGLRKTLLPLKELSFPNRSKPSRNPVEYHY